MEMGKNLNTTKKLGISFKSDYSNLELHVYGDTVDEFIDGLSRLKDGAFINYFFFKFQKRLTEEQLLRLDEIMITTDNAEQIVNYAKKRKEKINTQKYQDRLIELKDMWRLVDFTSFAIGADIEKTEDVLISSGDVREAKRLLQEVNGADTEKIKEFIFEKGSPHEVFSFAHTLKLINPVINMNDIFKAKKIVLESKDDFAIFMWAKYIGDVEEAREATNKIGDEEATKSFNKEFPKPIIKKSFFNRFKK